MYNVYSNKTTYQEVGIALLRRHFSCGIRWL